MSTGIKFTRDLFLKLFSLIYLLSFISIFYQIQGLWGDEGILPAKDFISKIQKKLNLKNQNFEFSNFLKFPCVFLYSEQFIGLLREIPLFKDLEYFKIFLNIGNATNGTISSVEISMFLLCLIGIILSCLLFLNFKYLFNPISFFVLWFIYLNFYLIGQEFMGFEADRLILEAGFLAVFYSPWLKKDKVKNEKYQQQRELATERLVYFLLRFVLFRYIISNSYVKFASNNFLYQNLNYFGYYLQNQAFPSPVSFYLYYNMEGIKKMFAAFLIINEVTKIPVLYIIIFIYLLF